MSPMLEMQDRNDMCVAPDQKDPQAVLATVDCVKLCVAGTVSTGVYYDQGYMWLPLLVTSPTNHLLKNSFGDT